MIFNTDINAKRNATYESTIKNLEKARDLLEKRHFNKEISDSEYIKRTQEINEQIKKYKKVIGQDY